MKIKRFFAQDMKTVLLQVKEELGDDAVIMSNKKVTGGIEIVAAIDGTANSMPISQSQKSSGQSSRYAGFSRRSMSNREIDEDRVDLTSAHSLTSKFTKMLKQYDEGKHSGQNTKGREDSLSALLKRNQAYDRNTNRNENSTSSHISNAISEGSKLAELLKHNHVDPPQPKLDPTRYDRFADQKSEDQSHQDFVLMRQEMMSIRRLLEHQVSGLLWQEVERKEPLRAMLIKRLERMGISLELADQLACYIPDETPPTQAWRTLLELMADQITVAKTDILTQGGVVALLGPTGVGKTTTIAKLAARAAVEYGSDDVALVTTDTYRIGAHEQLSIYGRIMGCPVRAAKDPDELSSIIYQLRNRRLILIDTAGMGQRDVRLSEQLDTLMHESGQVINSYLVLPATAQRKVLQETLDHFKRIPLSGCILTKLDESLSLGEIISVIIQNSLPIAYIANGQRVPEDLVVAQSKYLVTKANSLMEQSTENEPYFWNSDSEDTTPTAK